MDHAGSGWTTPSWVVSSAAWRPPTTIVQVGVEQWPEHDRSPEREPPSSGSMHPESMEVEVVHADEVRARWPCHERTSGTTFAVELPNGGRVHLLMYDQ